MCRRSAAAAEPLLRCWAVARRDHRGKSLATKGCFYRLVELQKCRRKTDFTEQCQDLRGPFADTAIHISQHGDIPYGGVKMDLATGMQIHVAGPGRGKGSRV